MHFSGSTIVVDGGVKTGISDERKTLLEVVHDMVDTIIQVSPRLVKIGGLWRHFGEVIVSGWRRRHDGRTGRKTKLAGYVTLNNGPATPVPRTALSLLLPTVTVTCTAL